MNYLLLMSIQRFNHKPGKKLINALDNKNYPSKEIVSIDSFQNRQQLKQVLSNIHKQYNNISRFSKNFSGLEEYNHTFEQHKTYSYLYQKDESKSFISEREKITINKEINGLNDLLSLINDFPLIENVDYNINMKMLHQIKLPLYELNNMIGIVELKDNIVDQVIYYIQEFHKKGNSCKDFMHTVIYGPPGTGKTETAKIIGKIFSLMGILKKGTFMKVTRTDLVAGYLGQTAIKTQEVIKKALGGVLFIDEAYALGNNEQRDSFAKECIDTLCEALSNHKEELMVIIAGYESELKTCFFGYNQGLDSRFTWRYNTDDYTYKELHQIFIKKIKDAGWSIKHEETISDKWFEKNMDYFTCYGRDMETLFAKTKICHSRRVFCIDDSEKTKIIQKDLDRGFELYLKNAEVENRKKDNKIPFMYV